MASSIPEPGVTFDASVGNTFSFENLYEKDRKLRAGSYGTVYTCKHLHRAHSDTTYAVKILDRKKLKKKDDVAVFREVAIMKELIHLPTVVRLIDFFESPEELFVVQVFAAGGDVFDRLSQRANYNEKDARDLAESLIETMEAVHQKGIVHRDLKPENLLLLAENDDSEILLADFGFARHTDKENQCTTRCGTPGKQLDGR